MFAPCAPRPVVGARQADSAIAPSWSGWRKHSERRGEPGIDVTRAGRSSPLAQGLLLVREPAGPRPHRRDARAGTRPRHSRSRSRIRFAPSLAPADVSVQRDSRCSGGARNARALGRGARAAGGAQTGSAIRAESLPPCSEGVNGRGWPNAIATSAARIPASAAAGVRPGSPIRSARRRGARPGQELGRLASAAATTRVPLPDTSSAPSDGASESVNASGVAGSIPARASRRCGPRVQLVLRHDRSPCRRGRLRPRARHVDRRAHARRRCASANPTSSAAIAESGLSGPDHRLGRARREHRRFAAASTEPSTSRHARPAAVACCAAPHAPPFDQSNSVLSRVEARVVVVERPEPARGTGGLPGMSGIRSRDFELKVRFSHAPDTETTAAMPRGPAHPGVRFVRAQRRERHHGTRRTRAARRPRTTAERRRRSRRLRRGGGRDDEPANTVTTDDY